MPDELALVVERSSPRTEWVLDHVLRWTGFRARLTDRRDAAGLPHLAYGGDGPAGPRGAWIREEPGGRDWPDPQVGPRIEVDLVNAIGEILTDGVNADAGPDAHDEHNRLRYASSWAAADGRDGGPLVDRWIGIIAASIESATGLRRAERWPDGRRACIGLSHDVDEPDRYALLRQVSRPWRLRRAPRTLGTEAARLARHRRGDEDPDAFWVFDELCELEARHGSRSTFFVAVTPFHHPTGALEDVHYDVGGERYRRQLARLGAAGFEVGLHAGYRSFEEPARFRDERARLEEASGREVRGLRHHYWHLGPNPAATLRAHEDAGFAYDSSVAFNDHIGFRRSAGLPYRPFDEAAERPLRTWQLPPFAMDSAAFRGGADVDTAVARVSERIDEIVEVGGFGSIDWHIQASVPRSVEFRDWGVAYGEIIDMLAARDGVWVTSLDEARAWIEERSTQVGLMT